MKTETFAALQARLAERIVEKAINWHAATTPGPAVCSANSKVLKELTIPTTAQQPPDHDPRSFAPPMRHPFLTRVRVTGETGPPKTAVARVRVVPATRFDHHHGPPRLNNYPVNYNPS